MTPSLILPARPVFDPGVNTWAGEKTALVSRRGFLRAAGATLLISVAAPLVVPKRIKPDPLDDPTLPVWNRGPDGIALNDGKPGERVLVLETEGFTPISMFASAMIALEPICKGDYLRTRSTNTVARYRRHLAGGSVGFNTYPPGLGLVEEGRFGGLPRA